MGQSKVNEKIYDHRALVDWSNATKNHLSKDMIFNEGHRLSITVYSILFVISTIANSTVLYLLIRKRLRCPSRMDIMLMHLAIADLMVTFLLMPLEIAWAYTVTWESTDLACRLMSFFRVFGLYLSSYVLICISIDRYFAILKPLKLSNNRGRMMLAAAWILSFFCSLPQAFLFHLEQHPNVKGYFQCVTFHSFFSDTHKFIYNIINMLCMYAFPLITFIYCYGAIYLEIYSKSQILIKGVERFRRSNDDVLSRAKKRTLKMTITIVIVFIVCWTPYYVICLWYWFDASSVDQVNPLVRKGLFIFASTNSCMNPIVYGAFNIRGRLRNNNTTASNRHTSLSYRRDSSRQFNKSLCNGRNSFLRADSLGSDVLDNTIGAIMSATTTAIATSTSTSTSMRISQSSERNGNIGKDVVGVKPPDDNLKVKIILEDDEFEEKPMMYIDCTDDSHELANLKS